ncbi:MAG: PAS domain S-box protein [Sedimentisphaerales bacterium]|nr:PAS domain S-box protein [Sedimentisphaerales bacterium]
MTGFEKTNNKDKQQIHFHKSDAQTPEGTLKISEEKYRLFFDTAANLILSVDATGLIWDCNKRIKDTLDYERSEIIGQSIAKIIHPDYMEQAKNCLSEILSKGSALQKEYRMVKKDGRIIDVEINANGLKNKEGKYVGGICIIQDITDRKEVKQILQKRTEELTIINEMAMDLTIKSSRKDICILVCEKLKSITGAMFTGITIYDSKTSELVVEQFSSNNSIINKAQKILGRKVKKLRIPLKPENVEVMLKEKAKKLEGLDDLMFGTLQRIVINTLTKVLQLGDVYGLVLHYGGELLGTMPIVMPKNKPSLSIEMLKNFANLVAASLQRAKAEEERIAALQEKAAVVDVMSDGLLVLGLDGKIISCNPSLLKMFSMRHSDEIVGKHFSEFKDSFINPSQDIQRISQLFMKFITGSFQDSVELEVRSKDNREFTISASASFLNDTNGDFMKVVVVLRDIMLERQLLEMEKEASATRTAIETIEGMIESVLLTDLNGVILQANSEFEKYTGYKRQDVIGKVASRLGFLNNDDCIRIEKEIVPKLIKKGFVRNVEMTVLRKDAKTIPILMNVKLVKDAHGKPKSIIATGTDITELKKAEKKLIEYQQQLQSMASKLSLTEESERRRIATELHDRIVQSLVFTKMKLDKLKSTIVSEESENTLEVISNMLDKVIEETQNLTYDLGSPTLYELGLEAAIEEWLSEEVEQKHKISTSFKVSGDSGCLSEDISGFLFRSVRELLVNAIKHGKAKQIDVSLYKDKNKIKLCVEDDGVGFELSKEGVPKDKKGGYGLFSIKEHLSHFGGTINIKSTKRQGTSIILEAPTKIKCSGR